MKLRKPQIAQCFYYMDPMKNMLEGLVCGCLVFFTLRFDAQIGLKIFHYEYFEITTDLYNEKAALS